MTNEAGNQFDFVLVEDGRGKAEIVLDKRPTRSAQFAAAELRYHIQKITGALLPIIRGKGTGKAITILVGQSRATREAGLTSDDFQPQEYLVGFRGGRIVLIGRDKDDYGKMDYADPDSFPGLYDEQGTAYAVYDFLERFCGVRWYLPTDLGTAHSRSRTLRVAGKEVRRSPAMKVRQQQTSIQYPADLCGSTIDPPKPRPVLEWREQMLWWHRQRMGGEPYAMNHSFYGYYDRFLKDHPEWFAQGHEGTPPQLCYANPDLIGQVIQDARDFFDGKGLKPGGVGAGDFFAMVPMDTSNSWCRCPRCIGQWEPAATLGGRGSFATNRASNYLYGFINQVARAIAKSHPGKYIGACAYSEYAYPPTREPLEPNVSIQLALHARNVFARKLQAGDTRILRAWMSESRTRYKYLWLYYCFPSLQAVWWQYRCFPGFFAHHVVRNMKEYRRAGVRGIFFEPSYLAPRQTPATWESGARDEKIEGQIQRSALLDQVEGYVTWKLADDPTRDGNRIIDDFFPRYYGAAAEPMRRLYVEMEETFANPANYPKVEGHQTEEIAWKLLGTPQRMRRFGSLMASARRLAAGGVERRRVALFDKGVWRYMQAGRQAYQLHERRKSAPMRTARIPRIAAVGAKGLAGVDWSKAKVLRDWRTPLGDRAPRRIEGRALHDGTNLYLRFEDLVNTAGLSTGKGMWSGDNWQVFVARHRNKPYFQLGVNMNGQQIREAFIDSSRGDPWDIATVVESDITHPRRWVVRVAFPLSELLPGGVKPGDRIYMNFFRAMWIRDVFAWSPTFTELHELSRLGEVILDK